VVLPLYEIPPCSLMVECMLVVVFVLIGLVGAGMISVELLACDRVLNEILSEKVVLLAGSLCEAPPAQMLLVVEALRRGSLLVLSRLVESEESFDDMELKGTLPMLDVNSVVVRPIPDAT